MRTTPLFDVRLADTLATAARPRVSPSRLYAHPARAARTANTS